MKLNLGKFAMPLYSVGQSQNESHPTKMEMDCEIKTEQLQTEDIEKTPDYIR